MWIGVLWIRDLKHRRDQNRAQKAQHLAKVELQKCEDIKATYYREMLAYSKKISRFRWVKVLDVATSPSYLRARDIIPGAARGLGKLTIELLLLVVEQLPPQDQARLALTNSHYLERIGTKCWRAMERRRQGEARMEYLCSIESDSQALGRTAAQLLACSHCKLSHNPKRFDTEEREKEPMSRVCYLKYGQVVSFNELLLTWAEMLAIPDNTRFENYYNIEVPWEFLGESDNRTYDFSKPKLASAKVDLKKINRTLYVRTPYRVPIVLSSADGTSGKRYIPYDICVSPCPHKGWTDLQSLFNCKPNHGTRWPLRCTTCRTEFEL